MAKPTIGEIVRRERERRRLSQLDLQRMSGVTASTISNLERDEIEPSAIKLAKVCSAIGITVDEVLAEAGHIPTAAERRAAEPPTHADINALREEMEGRLQSLRRDIDKLRHMLEERLPSDDCGEDDAADGDGTNG